MLQDRLGSVAKIERELDDATTLVELGEQEGDSETENEGLAQLRALKTEGERRELEALLSGEADGLDSYVEVHSGAGGTESCDWARMLLRMYVRWGERRKFDVEVLEETAGDEAGIKSATIMVKGLNAHGWLKTESGVHRLVRISPFDSNARRHTSFASVWVYPVVDDRIQIEIDESDCKIDTYRASGAGGQHVNKTESAVRITHMPTGIVVACQMERSQHKNRATAWNMLRARLYERELEIKEAKARRRRRVEDRDRLGPPDPLLRAAALPDGQRPAHRPHVRHARPKCSTATSIRSWRPRSPSACRDAPCRSRTSSKVSRFRRTVVTAESPIRRTGATGRASAKCSPTFAALPPVLPARLDRQPVRLAKDAAKVLIVGEAAFRGDLADRQVRFAQQPARPLHAPLAHRGGDAVADVVGEEPIEIGPAEMKLAAQPLRAKGLRKGGRR